MAETLSSHLDSCAMLVIDLPLLPMTLSMPAMYSGTIIIIIVIIMT